ncbi:phytanoyl-CoA dioxygenase [Amycolatopsis mediterranei S699]|uniref:Phytanoyl-CoA dioxygenase n=2 Tax=Amycolatopsis mediterranei TaxID=33910 RepID=A0A0H3D4J4_AMYMU|nr:phytanoyl-CoA dioxygenase family protein [Amycolatopsis mediterranei]ADJ45117.1 phytanoyl-CoA dioxygenase [Amycolatopsis mediterranei U32]AEK41873.1 phytanoyl-CoA dioxygenase [Amycolatopsis mediterranei S699]AFO76828.1 phytanoyl-CoA dioxygenase [Amycolatopsis mediterranei S699]AGT83956.1 phytanoyl-CoA dioxygenase [Amycolatopsis mediterranei RB]KDO08758.1 phytanoyl-CoA dioxygenase [Amycolatopsis mediterranei]
MTAHQTAPAPLSAADLAALTERLESDGIIGLPGAFPRAWVRQLGEDIDTAFAEARARPGGAVGRGPNRFYVEIHPEQLRGFAELAGHPWITAVAEAVLGPAYRIVEVGFDVPLEGAVDQPWHRDFPMPAETAREGRLTSLAVNVTAVDTEPDMGPFEIAPGTHRDDGCAFDHGMFPPREAWPRYRELATRKFPRMGDISIRSALTVHRGTANHSAKARPVLVLGLDAPGAGNDARHDTAVTREFWAALPESVRAHLHCPVVDVLRPITQKHTIEGLVMGA